MAGFSVERLVHFLSLLGQDVEVTVRQAPRGRRYGTVRSSLAKKLVKRPGLSTATALSGKASRPCRPTPDQGVPR